MVDDTEWEPIETNTTAVEPVRSPTTVPTQELPLPELIIKVTALGSVAPFEVPHALNAFVCDNSLINIGALQFFLDMCR